MNNLRTASCPETCPKCGCNATQTTRKCTFCVSCYEILESYNNAETNKKGGEE